MSEVANINGFTWLYGMWFVGDGYSEDWHAMLGKRDGKIQIEYRFRYYSPESKDPYDDKDRKAWYAFSATDDSDASLQAMLDTIKTFFPGMMFHYQSPIDFVDLQCSADDPKILFELGSRPWAHVKAGSDAERIMDK
jgi:hypothetical protein